MIILLWTALALLALGHSSPLDEWRKFKAEYGKEYTGAEENHRMKVFLENLKRIEEHNAKYEQGLVSFALGVNHLSDLELEEVHSRMMGSREEEEEEEKGDVEAKRRGPEEMEVELPEEVDWRTKGAVTPVKNQGHCGTCWAFSTTGVVEGQLFMKTGKLVSVSEQNLMDCAAHGCKGFSRHTALKYIQKYGIDTEKAYPYMAKTENCSFSVKDVATRIKKTVSLPRENEEALKQAVANIGPISVSVDAGHHSFQAYKKGVYFEPECQTKKRDHAVLVVGYGREGGHDYWLVKNSWGNHWGEAGYMKLARNRDNHCGVASSPLYPLV